MLKFAPQIALFSVFCTYNAQWYFPWPGPLQLRDGGRGEGYKPTLTNFSLKDFFYLEISKITLENAKVLDMNGSVPNHKNLTTLLTNSLEYKYILHVLETMSKLNVNRQPEFILQFAYNTLGSVKTVNVQDNQIQ